MLIERPESPGVVHRHGADRFPLHAELVIPVGQGVLFARDGGLQGMLLAGRHRLTPSGIPFLAPLVQPDGASLQSTLFFVPLEPVMGLEVRAQLGQVTGPNAPAFGLLMRALVSIQIDDPFRFGQLLVSMPPDGSVEETIETELAPRLRSLVAEMVGSGEVHIGTIGGAALGPIKEALDAGTLSLNEIGVRVADVTALELRPDAKEMERRAAAPKPDAGAGPTAPRDERLAWGLEGIPFRDAPSGARIAVAAHGSFEGDPVPRHLHDWIRGLIAQALHFSAASYSGSVQELPRRISEWSEWLTCVVGPAVEQQTGVRGRVMVGRVGLPRA